MGCSRCNPMHSTRPASQGSTSFLGFHLDLRGGLVLREAEVESAKGRAAAQAAKRTAVTQQTYCRSVRLSWLEYQYPDVPELQAVAVILKIQRRLDGVLLVGRPSLMEGRSRKDGVVLHQNAIVQQADRVRIGRLAGKTKINGFLTCVGGSLPEHAKAWPKLRRFCRPNAGQG